MQLFERTSEVRNPVQDTHGYMDMVGSPLCSLIRSRWCNNGNMTLLLRPHDFISSRYLSQLLRKRLIRDARTRSLYGLWSCHHLHTVVESRVQSFVPFWLMPRLWKTSATPLHFCRRQKKLMSPEFMRMFCTITVYIPRRSCFCFFFSGRCGLRLEFPTVILQVCTWALRTVRWPVDTCDI